MAACMYARIGCTISTAPISFSWRNNPLSREATSYRARHEAEKGSTCSATECYISPGERARDSRGAHARVTPHPVAE